MSPAEQAARWIAAQLHAAGYTAYFAGGCVRDRLLGREPKDFDVATNATAVTVQKLFERTVPVGAQFGVVLVLKDDVAVEVATFRSDAPYVDGRRPTSVRFSSPQEDAQRRDFTINGLFLDPGDDRVIDYVGGAADIRAGIIRGIGDARARIAEDRLRMLRAIRFAATLGFVIEPRTFEAVRAAAPTITDMSWERIGDELVRMLSESNAGTARRAFELLDESGLLVHVLPEVAAMKGVQQSADYHPEGDVFLHTLGLLQQLDRPTETLALGALLHDVGKPVTAATSERRITFYGHCERGAEMAVAICQRLRRSRETWERVEMLVRDHLRHVNARDMRLSTLKRFLGAHGIAELLELARMDALASNKDLSSYEFCQQKLAEFGAVHLKPQPLVRGQDLIELGMSPGPAFKEILDAVQEAQLEGALATRQQALDWVKDKFCPAGD
jgi:poly(A) polymerase